MRHNPNEDRPMKRYAFVLAGVSLFSIFVAVFPVVFTTARGAKESLLPYEEARDFKKLRDDTLRMIERDPSNIKIYFANSAAFLARPEYHAEVLRLMEQRAKAKPTRDKYWILANICQRRALSIKFRTEDEKRRFLKYFELDTDDGFPKQDDEKLIAKTIEYYRKSIELAKAGWFGLDVGYANMYSRNLVEFYSRANRYAEALDLCRDLAHEKSNLTDASFLLAYGEALYAAGKAEEAETWLLKVRSNDHEGFEHGPACHTVDAETTLGLIALKYGDLDAAASHLQASTRVQRCCHNSTKGFPTSLASALLEKGQSAQIVAFCQIVLRDFTPHADYIQALLARAKAVGEKKPSP